jgi:hypothetical protein
LRDKTGPSFQVLFAADRKGPPSTRVFESTTLDTCVFFFVAGIDRDGICAVVVASGTLSGTITPVTERSAAARFEVRSEEDSARRGATESKTRSESEVCSSEVKDRSGVVGTAVDTVERSGSWVEKGVEYTAGVSSWTGWLSMGVGRADDVARTIGSGKDCIIEVPFCRYSFL